MTTTTTQAAATTPPRLTTTTVVDTLRELRRCWDRHGGRAREMGFWAMANHRIGRRFADSDNALVRRVGSRLYGAGAFALDVMAGLQVNRETVLGQDVHLVHGWNIKIHPDAIVGDRVGIMHDVTIGTTLAGQQRGAPVIGNDVFIGCGARIIGPVRIGDGAIIGANSLVITDVPPGATAVGVPARVLRYTGRGAPAETVGSA